MVKFVNTYSLFVLRQTFVLFCSILNINKPLPQRLLYWEDKFVLWSKVDELSYQ